MEANKETSKLDSFAIRTSQLLEDLTTNLNKIERFTKRMERGDEPEQEGIDKEKDPDYADHFLRMEALINRLGFQTERTGELARKLETFL